ncbi:hypothetical protein BDFB_013418 [Asbolus verrucosus]|uniref:Uncharacterized protein n=1 Tax=Asbolus verrucosus TaxID=1661398 RepID=A0A482VY94_ASBVE|nr:hypothetical protein BDFB_013418 [Asbolus verrucosus]
MLLLLVNLTKGQVKLQWALL